AVPAPALDTAPAPGGETRLPRQATALPDDWAALPVVTALSGPVLALAQFADGRIHLVKAGGRVPLDVPADAAGEGGTPLRPNSLAPDGTLAAFPQRDAVVVVDLVVGQARRYPLPGANEVVLWRGDRLLVEQEGADHLLDLATGEAVRLPYRGFGGTAGYRDVRIVSPGDGGSTVIREGEAEVALPVRHITDRGRVPAGPGGEHGWQRDGLVAVSAPAHDDLGPSAGVVVVADLESGQVVRTLLLPSGSDCGEYGCPVRGWLGQDTVLVERGDRLLGWNIRTGALSRVADLPPDVTAYSLRPG
ncbi:hypothetical protein HII36_54935, partial [Nonomuraea sp. NN258]|uniref:hypothetical protein n=1 Tax=Nonomuraea antri TaxID=2730852 RepID=UPI001C2B78A4